MTNRTQQDPLEARLTDIETRIAFSDDTVEQLNTTIALQQREIEELRRAIQLLHQQLKSLQENPLSQPSDEPPPPHY